MSMLGYYCRRTTETKGLEHKTTLTNLRNYIKTTPTQELLYAINLMNNLDYLKALWEAGLPTELQQAVLKRYEEITQRREKL